MWFSEFAAADIFKISLNLNLHFKIFRRDFRTPTINVQQ